MPRLNTICVICDDKFGSGDIIQSTYCGHIFHKYCLDNWKLMKLSCPMCQREFSSETFAHQLFLELDDHEVISDENNCINVPKAEVQSTNECDIQDQMRKMQLHFQSFQKQFAASEQSKQKLESQIQILDRKLNQLSDELEKVKVTRENYITTTEQYDCSPLIASNCVNKNENVEKPQSYCSETDNYVVIEDFPIKHKTSHLEDKIIELGTMMHLSISRYDICSVRELRRHEYVPKTSDKIALLVNFKTNDMKNKFLAAKNILKKYLTTSYTLRPIEDDNISVYLYANEKLKHYGGFTDVSYLYDDCVNVTHKDGQEFQVRSKMDVDSLIKRHIEETAVKAAITKKKMWS